MPSDQRLKHDIVAALSWAPNVTDADTGMTVTKGVVTQFGHVDRFAQKRAAETAAGGVKGIKGLAKILAAMDRSWFFNPEDVTVVAEGGKVVLSGNVRSWHERNIAAEIAWAAPGATDVENNLVVV